MMSVSPARTMYSYLLRVGARTFATGPAAGGHVEGNFKVKVGRNKTELCAGRVLRRTHSFEFCFFDLHYTK